MKVARLVSGVSVFDFTGGVDQGLSFKFTGTGFGSHYARNVTGKALQEVYIGDEAAEKLFAIYERAYRERRACHAKRYVRFERGIRRMSGLWESIMFPCSGDGEVIDYGIGYVHMAPIEDRQENYSRIHEEWELDDAVLIVLSALIGGLSACC